MSGRRFTDWEHEPDEFDRQAEEYGPERERDALDDMDDDDFEAWWSGKP